MGRIEDFFYRLKYRLFKRDEWARVPTPKFNPGYHDQRERVLHAVMQMLIDYVDEETIEDLIWRSKPESYTSEYFGREPTLEEQTELTKPYVVFLDAYRYWTFGRAEEEKRLEEAERRWYDSKTFKFEPDDTFKDCSRMVTMPNEGYTDEDVVRLRDEAMAASNEFDRREQEVLENIIKYRQWMWV